MKKGDDELVNFPLRFSSLSILNTHAHAFTHSHTHMLTYRFRLSSRGLRKKVGDGFYLVCGKVSLGFFFPSEPLSLGEVKVHIRVCFVSL